MIARLTKSPSVILRFPLALLRSGILPLALTTALMAPPSVAAGPARSSTALIRTIDLGETVDWYRDKLGFRVVSDLTRVQARTVVLERSGFLIEVTEDDRAVPSSPLSAPEVEVTGSAEGPAVSYLVSDVDAELDRLRTRGVNILAAPHDELEGRFRVALIQDNAGRLVEIREPLGSGADFHAEGR
jgi:catechol 2,3-dioxygenase-like lactoylglutathione lyase family enzyme